MPANIQHPLQLCNSWPMRTPTAPINHTPSSKKQRYFRNNQLFWQYSLNFSQLSDEMLAWTLHTLIHQPQQPFWANLTMFLRKSCRNHTIYFVKTCRNLTMLDNQKITSHWLLAQCDSYALDRTQARVSQSPYPPTPDWQCFPASLWGI